PVAVVSLMTAAALEPLATAGSEAFIAYAVLMSLLIGLFQLALGLLKLGMVVNFLAHPVVNGFTNAAAIIIATSQLSSLFGVYIDKSEHHYETIINVVKAALDYIHWPTFGMAVLGFVIMWGTKKINKRLPSVLIAVVITTVTSWAVGYEHVQKTSLSSIKAPDVVETVKKFNEALNPVKELNLQRTQLTKKLMETKKHTDVEEIKILDIEYAIDKINLFIDDAKQKGQEFRGQLRKIRFEATVAGNGELEFYKQGELPADKKREGRLCRLKIGESPVDIENLSFNVGGAVVGDIPKGLPKFALPRIDFSVVSQIIVVAIIISLIGFMEAISIAKAMAAKTGQRLDPNQELIGQGLSNIIGSFGQSYPVSGSFSRSAVNLQAGAVSGMSSVFTSALVLLTLLFFTTLLYHLPQSVLAVVIMMAVAGLINVHGFIHAWHAQKYDGIAAVLTFVATLAFAPHLDKGILIGVLFSIGHYLYRNMKPTVTSLALSDDGTLRSTSRRGLKECIHIAFIRFDGTLFFANTNYLEDFVLDKTANMPNLRHIIFEGSGINELDASGEEMLSLLIDRIRAKEQQISFCGLKHQVLEVLKRTKLYEKIGEKNIFPDEQRALLAIHQDTHYNTTETACPLLNVSYL
ncbi:MAG TPA: SulP family inorganic anion transporter, partial [Thermodesulfovibrionia bacterium]|nr:SulP family inorganic anion transporter [Thermodesulfovibrionia bacterium]